MSLSSGLGWAGAPGAAGWALALAVALAHAGADLVQHERVPLGAPPAAAELLLASLSPHTPLVGEVARLELALRRDPRHARLPLRESQRRSARLATTTTAASLRCSWIWELRLLKLVNITR